MQNGLGLGCFNELLPNISFLVTHIWLVNVVCSLINYQRAVLFKWEGEKEAHSNADIKTVRQHKPKPIAFLNNIASQPQGGNIQTFIKAFFSALGSRGHQRTKIHITMYNK